MPKKSFSRKKKYAQECKAHIRAGRINDAEGKWKKPQEFGSKEPLSDSIVTMIRAGARS